jgi:hypothetical protein
LRLVVVVVETWWGRCKPDFVVIVAGSDHQKGWWCRCFWERRPGRPYRYRCRGYHQAADPPGQPPLAHTHTSPALRLRLRLRPEPTATAATASTAASASEREPAAATWPAAAAAGAGAATAAPAVRAGNCTGCGSSSSRGSDRDQSCVPPVADPGPDCRLDAHCSVVLRCGAVSAVQCSQWSAVRSVECSAVSGVQCGAVSGVQHQFSASQMVEVNQPNSKTEFGCVHKDPMKGQRDKDYLVRTS